MASNAKLAIAIFGAWYLHYETQESKWSVWTRQLKIVVIEFLVCYSFNSKLSNLVYNAMQ